MIYYVVHKVTHQNIWLLYRTFIYTIKSNIKIIYKENVQLFKCRNKKDLAWKSEGQSEGEENGEKVWFIASYLKLLCRLQLFHKLEKKTCCFHKLMYSSGDPHTAIMTLSSMFASDICLRSPRRNHVSTRARSLLVNAANFFAKVHIFQLERFARITPQNVYHVFALT